MADRFSAIKRSFLEEVWEEGGRREKEKGRGYPGRGTGAGRVKGG